MPISSNFGEASWCSFLLRVLRLKHSSPGGTTNAKPKDPPDASGAYNYIYFSYTSPSENLSRK